MPSATYQLLARAIRERKQMLCSYDGYRREICPTILGHSDGREKALVFQFAGETSKGPLKDPDWKCFEVAAVTNAKLRDGPWFTGRRHQQSQSCVKNVDLDVNPDNPYI